MVKDSVITLKGDAAEVVKVEIIKRDGKYILAAYGQTKTSSGDTISLQPGIEPAESNALDELWAMALPVLRRKSGLE